MDKIWYRNPSKLEVIGPCGGDNKTNEQAETLKKYCNSVHVYQIGSF